MGEFKKKEIGGWAKLAETSSGPDIPQSLWKGLPHLEGSNIQDESGHWAQASLLFPIAVALMGSMPGKKILEIGASVGWASYQFSKLGAEVIASDLYAQALKQAAVFFDEGICFERLCADGENLPLAEETFDVVFCCAAIHHFEHPAELLREISRVLKPQGRFIAINEAYRPLLRSESKTLRESKTTQLHLEAGIQEQVFTHRQYKQFFESAGLTFSSVHPRWDVIRDRETIQVIKNIGLRQESFSISDTNKSTLRRLVHKMHIEKLIGQSSLLADAMRYVLFNYTNSFRILIGDKVRL